MIGETISHYTILEKLGEGGMGVVYKAEDLRLRRTVAMKFLPREMTFQADARERFIREAQSASALDHPNICPVYEVDETADGACFIVMAYCDGRPLEARIRQGPLPLAECIDIAIQIADGLKSAHGHDIVHRDLKPANVIATSEGRVRIVDFGLAKLRGRSKLTKERTTLGTIEYMSPEQARGEDVDHRTDIWSLGCILYELLTGRTPFRGEYEQAVVYSILYSAPQPVSVLRSGIPDDLWIIVRRCLEKNPADRYRSAGDVIADLRPIRHKLSDAGRPPAATGAAAHHRKWRPAPVGAGLFIGAVSLVLLWMLFRPGDGPDRKSVAVLPFSNLTGNPGEEYFSDGITDDILTELYKIGDLKVVSRTTMQKYRHTEKSVREIGGELGAGVVLEGSVRRAGSRLRIVAQLIDARTDDHLWAETYDRGIEDVFEVQSEIARKIAGALHARLLPEEEARLAPPPPTDAEAYRLILEGRSYAVKATAADIDSAIAKFNRALAVDSNNARAWAYLATAYARQADWGAVSADSGYERARRAARRSLAIDDRLAQGHSIMGWIKRSHDWDWAGAGTECRKAYEIAPGDVSVIRSLAHLEKSLGRFDEAIALLRKASVLDPKVVPIHTSIGLLSIYAGRLDDAAAAYRKALDLNPGYPAAHTFLGIVFLLQDRPREAIEEIRLEGDEGWRLYGLTQAYEGSGMRAESDSALRALIRGYGDESMYQVAEAYAYRGEADSAFAWLERAYAARDAGLSELKGDPFMIKIEKDQRYVPLLKKMKLPI